MKLPRSTVVLACALTALAAASSASAELSVGVADSRPKSSPEQAERFYATMADVGLKENRISVEWDPARPTTIPDEAPLAQAVSLATARGIRVTFAVYPTRPDALTGSPSAPERFAAFLAHLARTYPQVRDFIVGNEPNKHAFWQPQFVGRRAVACAAYAGVLAAAYDALKGVDQRIVVIGLAVGARGNDNPLARSNISISPVRCLRDVGRAYRASRRTRPLMDELSFHPYPQNMSDTIETGYRWPNAGLANLARIKQAVWDAFNRTAQPTFPEPGAPLRTMRLRLNEIGWQVSIPPSSMHAYYGRESVATTDEGHQAAVYGNLIPYLACDASVRSALIFNLVDEPNLDRWQSGLLRADWTIRPSYNIVKSAIAARATRCTGRPGIWRHATKVVAPRVRFGDTKRPRREKETVWSFPAGAEEGALFTAAVFPVAKAGALSAADRARVTRALRQRRPTGAVLSTRGVLAGGWERIVRFPKRRLTPGYYAYGIRLTAEMNPARTITFVSGAFRVGTPKQRPPARRPR